MSREVNLRTLKEARQNHTRNHSIYLMYKKPLDKYKIYRNLFMNDKIKIKKSRKGLPYKSG